MTFDPIKYYSLAELVEQGQKGYFPIKTKPTLLKLINTRRLYAINVGSSSEKPVYAIKGETLNMFLSEYGTIHPRKFRQDLPMVRKKRTGRQTSSTKKKHLSRIKERENKLS